MRFKFFKIFWKIYIAQAFFHI